MIVRISLFAAALLAIATSSGQASEHFTQQFGSGPLNTRLLKLIGPYASQAVKQAEGGLLVAVPVKKARPAQAGVGTKFSVSGDFEVTLAYQLVEIPEPEEGYGTGVMLDLVTAERPAVTVSLTHRRLPNGKAVFGTNLWVMVDGKAKGAPKHFPTEPAVDRGQLRVVRTGSTIRYMVAEGNSDEFRELRQSELGVQPLKSVHVMGDTGGSELPLKVCLKNFSIRADELPLRAPTVQQKSIWVVWALASLAGGGVLVGSGIWYRRYRLHV